VSDERSHTEQRWSQHFETIDLEIARHALACDVPLLDHGVIERVLRNEAQVCRKPNPPAFESLRSLLMVHDSVHDRAVLVLGEEETTKLIGEVTARLQHRIGNQLGGRPV
jgi:hypothetical protein